MALGKNLSRKKDHLFPEKDAQQEQHSSSDAAKPNPNVQSGKESKDTVRKNTSPKAKKAIKEDSSKLQKSKPTGKSKIKKYVLRGDINISGIQKIVNEIEAMIDRKSGEKLEVVVEDIGEVDITFYQLVIALIKDEQIHEHINLDKHIMQEIMELGLVRNILEPLSEEERAMHK